MPSALIAIFTHPKETFESHQKAVLHDKIVPMVRMQPGFVTGQWSYDPVESKSYSYVVFENEEQAKAMAGQLGSAPPPGVPDMGVRLESVRVAVVQAEAFGR